MSGGNESFRSLVELRRKQLKLLGHRARLTLGLAAAVGAITGLTIAGFEWVVDVQMLDRLGSLPLWAMLCAPAIGLFAARWLLGLSGAGTDAATADEYIKTFHGSDSSEKVRGRLLASIATLGTGGALGLEGPSIYLGSSIGRAVQRRLDRFGWIPDSRMLLVCGAAAGVAAIFKAPATGLVFALEVPYREDFARRFLVPAGIASAASYLTFVSLRGTERLFSVQGAPPFELGDLMGSVLLGALCGLGARWFILAIGWAKRSARNRNMWVCTAAGAILAGLTVASLEIFGEALTLGPGYSSLSWALAPDRAMGAVLILLALRMAAATATVAGGGVGGLFVPLVVAGGLLGRAVGVVVGPETGQSFFPLVGICAFLGAGYRVPLAGIMFAAETTGRPGFIIPGLIASMVAQLFMGQASASGYQVRSDSVSWESPPERLRDDPEQAEAVPPTTPADDVDNLDSAVGLEDERSPVGPEGSTGEDS